MTNSEQRDIRPFQRLKHAICLRSGATKRRLAFSMRRYNRVQGQQAMKAVAPGCLAGVFALSLSATALAQEAKSVPLAKQLATALDAAKLDSVAATRRNLINDSSVTQNQRRRRTSIRTRTTSRRSAG